MVNLLAEIYRDKKFHDIKFMSYSGRNMYGKECLAIRCDDNTTPTVELVKVIQLATDYVSSQNGIEELRDLLQLFSYNASDSLAFDSVLYFPNIEWEEFMDLVG
jgi:hypothetical protein